MAAALMTAMAGCATAAEEVPVRGGGSCDASKAQGLIGRASSQDLRQEASRLTGARVVRRIPEGGIVTMDFREDRVNLYLDARDMVVKLTCG